MDRWLTQIKVRSRPTLGRRNRRIRRVTLAVHERRRRRSPDNQSAGRGLRVGTFDALVIVGESRAVSYHLSSAIFFCLLLSDDGRTKKKKEKEKRQEKRSERRRYPMPSESATS